MPHARKRFPRRARRHSCSAASSASAPAMKRSGRLLELGDRQFRARWADHNVRLHQTGAKRFQHPVVGELTLTFEI